MAAARFSVGADRASSSWAIGTERWGGQVSQEEQAVPMKKPKQQLIAEVPRRQDRPELTIGIDLGDVWSH